MQAEDAAEISYAWSKTTTLGSTGQCTWYDAQNRIVDLAGAHPATQAVVLRTAKPGYCPGHLVFPVVVRQAAKPVIVVERHLPSADRDQSSYGTYTVSLTHEDPAAELWYRIAREQRSKGKGVKNWAYEVDAMRYFGPIELDPFDKCIHITATATVHACVHKTSSTSAVIKPLVRPMDAV